MHRLLAHQLARATGTNGEVDLPSLLGTVGLAYAEADRDRHRTDRAALVMCQEMEQLNADLNNLAHHDALTGLANRGLFCEIMARQLALAQRDGTSIAVFCIDFDRFKSINDTLGHHAGDLLLIQAAERMRMAVRDCDTLARIGGDEFLLLQTSVSQPESAAHLAGRLVATLTEPFDLDGQQGCIGVSIGIALSLHDGRHVDELIKNADIALYRAKMSGRGRFCFFKSSMGALLRQRREMEQEIALAIAGDGFDLAFQPWFGGDRYRTVVGFEALLRWPNAGRGPIAPEVFIPIAEETGLIIPLGTWVLESACREAASWPGSYRIAVNVSPRQIGNGDFAGLVADVLRRSGLAPDRLEIEITETVLMKDAERAMQVLRQLKRLGVRIALDDFGTGYSSLSYLQRFPFDKVKIDRSFIHSLSDSANARAIVGAILAMCRQLGLDVTAEGIETGAQLTQLRAHDCDQIQGFLLGRPIPWQDVRRFISCQTERRDMVASLEAIE